jgi:hypothetical protein
MLRPVPVIEILRRTRFEPRPMVPGMVSAVEIVQACLTPEAVKEFKDAW